MSRRTGAAGGVPPAGAEAALRALRAALPVETRLAAAAPELRHAYGRIAGFWHRQRRAPAASAVGDARLAALVALDAVVEQPAGIGCYPFSAGETPFPVVPDGGPVLHAFCAIDALAIADLLRCAVRVEATCADCGARHPLVVQPGGALAAEASAAVCVTWPSPPDAAPSGPCCASLCPAIRFRCARPAGREMPTAACLTLPAAVYVATALFAFQRRLAIQ